MFQPVDLKAVSHVSKAYSSLGVSSAMVYQFVYDALVVGTLAVVSLVASKGDNATTFGAINGLDKTNPVLVLGMTGLLLARAGVPLTSGFVAKFGIIRATVSVESYALAVIVMLAAVIAAFLYLRIMVSIVAERARINRASGNPSRIVHRHYCHRCIHAYCRVCTFSTAQLV